MSDAAIRSLAKRKPVVLLNRMVGEVASVVIDNVQAIKKATEHLIGLGHASICYLAGPGGLLGRRDALARAAGGGAGAGSARPADRPVPADDPRWRGRGRASGCSNRRRQ